MAIHLWDDALQTYRNVDLAQYGADGTLTGAFAWIDGQWLQLWPIITDFTDDFTSPELHSRWTLAEGSYSPPGLSGLVAGPTPAADFEATIELPGTPLPSFMLAVMDMNTGEGVMLFGSIGSGYGAMDPTGQHVDWMLEHADFAWSQVTLRRVAGLWSLHADGQPVLGADMLDPDSTGGVPVEFADPFPGQEVPLLVGGWEAMGGGDTKITGVAYTDLT